MATARHIFLCISPYRPQMEVLFYKNFIVNIVLVFEAATEKEKSFKTLQEDTARLSEETKACQQRFRHNRETYQR